MYVTTTHKNMKKTTIYLLDDQHEKLKNLSKRRGGKISEWIRRAIDSLILQESKK